jgi:hypothetical protein
MQSDWVQDDLIFADCLGLTRTRSSTITGLVLFRKSPVTTMKKGRHQRRKGGAGFNYYAIPTLLFKVFLPQLFDPLLIAGCFQCRDPRIHS